MSKGGQTGKFGFEPRFSIGVHGGAGNILDMWMGFKNMSKRAENKGAVAGGWAVADKNTEP